MVKEMFSKCDNDKDDILDPEELKRFLGYVQKATFNKRSSDKKRNSGTFSLNDTTISVMSFQGASETKEESVSWNEVWPKL